MKPISELLKIVSANQQTYKDFEITAYPVDGKKKFWDATNGRLTVRMTGTRKELLDRIDKKLNSR